MPGDSSTARRTFETVSIGVGILAGACVAYLVSDHAANTRFTGTPGQPQTGLSANETIAVEAPASSEWLTAALERVNELGLTAEAIEQVASSLSRSRAQGLRQLAIERLAGEDVSAAIDYALSFDPRAARTAAVQRIAAVAARSDPEAALSLASLLPNGAERAAFVAQILEVWAANDPAAVFDFLEATGVSALTVSADTFAALALVEPERLWSILDRLPAGIRTQYEPAVIDALLVSDPGGLYAYLDTLPLDTDRDRLLRTVAGRHSQRDPKEGLSYILTLDWLPIGVTENMLAAIAADDLPYALDRAIETLVSGTDREQDSSIRSARLPMLIAAAARSGASDIPAAVDIIANHPDQRVRRQLDFDNEAGLLGWWADVDPEGALNWTIRNSSKVSPGFLEHLGQLSAAASGNASDAQQVLNALPEDLRGFWMAGVAEGLAASSLDAAVEWLEPVRGAPVYTTVIDHVLRSAASTQPTTVAQLIDSLPDAPRSGLVLTVAKQWGSQEPVVAADWLSTSRNIDDELRALAVRQIVLDWAGRDLRDAETWAQGLPNGPFRDSALGAILPEAAESRVLDSELLDAFSSATVRMQGLVDAMDALRRTDPDLGRSLIDRFISDPELRERAEQRLEGRADYVYPRFIDGVTVL